MPIYSVRFLLLAITTILFSCGQKDAQLSYTEKGSNVNEFVGDAACIECHQEAYNDWRGSHHDWAMKLPTDSTVLADFNNVNFTSDNESFFFHKKDSGFFVTTGTKGNEKEYKIAYTFGVTPLQQYLIKFANGKYQTLRATWDTEKKQWYNQYPGQQIPQNDWLHWSQGGQRWNTMCAECHSTNLHKNYSLANDAFNTTYSSINVSCEACHGAGSAHVQWAAVDDPTGDPQVLVVGAEQTSQLNMCAGCHARRSKLTDVVKPEATFDDQFMLQTISAEFYHADGQIKEEDYVFGSFVQSKMFHKQVKCSDCHNSHSMKLKLAGNTLCMQCHEPKYNTEAHHFHKQDTDGSQCINCHMTGAVYMGNDFRRDHSFRIPRPDQSVDHGTPNACSGCHKDKSDVWAAEWIVKWYGAERPDHFSDHLIKASQPPYDEQTKNEVLQFINNLDYPAIARATAIEYYPLAGADDEISMLITALKDSSALVRYHALAKLQVYPLNQKVSFALKHITDKSRLVRIGASQLIIELDINHLEPAQQGAVNSARKELIQMLEANADFPIGRLQLGDYYFRQNDVPHAIKEYEMALKMDSLLTLIYGNLATAYNIVGNNQQALATLDQLLILENDYAHGYYLRGLLYHEIKNDKQAIADLEEAKRLDPANFRVYYNLANLYLTNSNLPKAKQTMVAGLQLQPNSEEGQYLLRLIESKEGQQ